MKVIIIEEDNHVNNSKASESEMLFNKLKRQGVDVHLVQSNPQYLVKPLTDKQKKKYFIAN